MIEMVVEMRSSREHDRNVDSYTGLVKKFTTEMRRARLGRRHGLAQPIADPVEVANSLVALHSSDPSTVYLSVQARVPDFETTDLEELLYQKRELVRIYGMRRTLWVTDRETLPLVDRSSTNQIAPASRKRLEEMLVDGDVTDDGERWLNGAIQKTLQAIDEAGEALARELSDEIPELKEKLVFHNKKGELIGKVGVSTRVLVQLALESEIIRTRPLGTWISSQYRWARMENWLGTPIADLEAEAAEAALIDRWLYAFGPATTTDLRWWTGWTVARVKQALDTIDAEEVKLDDGIGWVQHGDTEEEPDSEPWLALLPSLDSTTMGWKERDWYLGEHYETLFDRNGNAGPTIWVNGRIVGGWAQKKSGEVVFEILNDVGGDTETAIADKASALQGWIGDIRVTPRFRSPHDKRLSTAN